MEDGKYDFAISAAKGIVLIKTRWAYMAIDSNCQIGYQIGPTDHTITVSGLLGILE